MLRGTTLVAGQCPAALRRQPGFSGADGPLRRDGLHLPKIGEQPDGITVSIPAQPTLSQSRQNAAPIRTVQPAAPRPVHIPPGAVFHQTTALYGAARDTRSSSSHLQILYKFAMPQGGADRRAHLPAAQGFLLLYPKRTRFVKTCFSKAAPEVFQRKSRVFSEKEIKTRKDDPTRSAFAFCPASSA